MASFPKTIYVTREQADGGECLFASAAIEDLIDKGEKLTVAVYEVKEYLVAGLKVEAETLRKVPR